MMNFDAIGKDIPESVKQQSDTKSAEEAIFEIPINEKKLEMLGLREQQVEGLEKKVDHFQQLYVLRRNVALFIFALIFVWLLCVMALVFLGSYEVYYLKGNCNNYELHSWYQKIKALPDGCAYLKRSTFLNLSESIVIALITTTTANVLGLSYIVAKWLFPKGANDSTDISPSV